MFLILWTYLCLGIFVIAAGIRVYKQLSMPMHLRWELYPVKTEVGEKAKYGGSYLEESNWWEKKREHSLWNEIKYMVPEIVLLRGLWEENRKLWWVSFPFHFGLYMLIATFGLLFFGAIAMLAGVAVTPGGGVLGALLYYATIFTGFVGLILGTIGCLGLLIRRLTDSEMTGYTSIVDYFNLIVFLVFLVAALLAWLFFDHAFVGARLYIYGLLTFGGAPTGLVAQTSVFGTVTAIMTSFLIAYVPLTHMSHMFMKYFMYHEVRWEDSPNIKGGKVEANILKYLGFKPTWSAPHIGADGNKNWADIATSMPEDKE